MARVSLTHEGCGLWSGPLRGHPGGYTVYTRTDPDDAARLHVGVWSTVRHPYEHRCYIGGGTLRLGADHRFHGPVQIDRCEWHVSGVTAALEFREMADARPADAEVVG